jgi:hypothetical protein
MVYVIGLRISDIVGPNISLVQLRMRASEAQTKASTVSKLSAEGQTPTPLTHASLCVTPTKP